MGNFPLFAHANCPDGDVTRCRFTKDDREIDFIKDSVKARPGYFSLQLNNSISAGITSSNHSALYNFTFPASAENTSPLLLVDLVDLPKSRSRGKASVNPDTARITGSGTFEPSFGTGNYELHFCTDFKGGEIRETGTFLDKDVRTDRSSIEAPSKSSTSAGAFVHFDSPPDGSILARVGISFKSVDQACSHGEKEIPEFDFTETVRSSEDAWSQKLNAIEVESDGVDKDFETIFWSGIYRTMISPQDYTGENTLWESNEPYYDSFYWYVSPGNDLRICQYLPHSNLANVTTH